MKQDMQSWAAHVTAIEREAMSVSAYAKREGVSAAALYYWRHKLRATAPVSETPKRPQFVQLRVAEPAAAGSAACTLVLAPGMRLEMERLPAPEWLAQFARAARGAC